jgi:hypothetical protein
MTKPTLPEKHRRLVQPSKPRKKAFDCVEFKRELQAKVAAKYKGMTLEESIEARRKWLDESDDPMAIWWRSVAENQTTRKTSKRKNYSGKK